jgi:radical SAM protein with 4Fe4S-binding SPASM domain
MLHFSPLKIIKKGTKKITKNKLFYYFANNFFDWYQYNHMNLFNNVEIETLNRCNGVCPFCPVNKNEKQRPYKRMSETLFIKLIDELNRLDYRGSIALYSNNEPFLDKRIIEFYSYTRHRLTKAYIFIYTNATLLTFTKFLKILPYLDKMIINNYNDNYEKLPIVTRIYDYLQEHVELKEKVKISMRLLNQVRTSRGGQAPNKGKQKAPRIKCTLPFRQIIIRPDGKISLCSNDALGVYTIGDSNEHTLKEIWENDYYREIRKEILKNGRKNLELCRDCDNVILSNIVSEFSG